MMFKTFALLLLIILAVPPSRAQPWLSYLEKPKLSGIHVYQDSLNKVYTIVAGSDELVASPTFIYQLDSNSNIIAAKKIESSGKNITSSACSNYNRTIVSRSVQGGIGQLTANLICFDRKLKVQWSTILESSYITYVNAVRIGALGNIFLVGNGISGSPSKNFSFLCKIDPYGSKVWELTDFTGGDTTAFWRLAVDQEDNTYTVGSLGKKGLLTKINPAGDVEWQQSLFYRGETRLFSIAPSQGFIYVLGADEDSPSEGGKVFIAKISAAGQVVWTTLLSNMSTRLSAANAMMSTAANGDMVFTLSGTDLHFKRCWVTVQIDRSGAVIHSTSYQENEHELFPRDLFLGKDLTVAGIGTLVVTGQPDKYPLFFKSTLPDLLDGRRYCMPFSTNQKSVQLELLPVSIDFINYVAINFADFPLTVKDDACIIKPLKNQANE